jgi:hypothetical protein
MTIALPDHPTFICKDCGAAVFDALGEVRERCYPCQWVAIISDPADRAAVRAWVELIADGVRNEAADRFPTGTSTLAPYLSSNPRPSPNSKPRA